MDTKLINMKNNYLAILVLILLGTVSSKAQQDPQYTQYMYNTQVVNPAYVGSKEALNFGLLGRTQWVNFEGAPKTEFLLQLRPVEQHLSASLDSEI